MHAVHVQCTCARARARPRSTRSKNSPAGRVLVLRVTACADSALSDDKKLAAGRIQLRISVDRPSF